MRHALQGAVAVAAILVACSALAADLPLRAVAHAAQELPSKQITVPTVANSIWSTTGQREPDALIRPPAMVPRTDSRLTLAVTATPPEARDNHVLEFLRWKEQRGAANSRAFSPSR